MTTLLEIQRLEVDYGGVSALRGVSLEVREGSVATIIGPNGAGKSTLLRSISRVKRPSAGRISFDGIDLLQREAHEISRLGIAHVPKDAAFFARLASRQTWNWAQFQLGTLDVSLMRARKPRMPSFRSSESGADNWERRCLAANNRCLPLPVP